MRKTFLGALERFVEGPVPLGLALFCFAMALVTAQGPLTPIGQLRGRTDASGRLYTIAAAASGAQGPLTPIANLRGRTDASGSLYVTLAGGTVTPDVSATGDGTCAAPAWTFASETDLGAYRAGSGNIVFCNGSVALFDLGSTGAGVFNGKVEVSAGAGIQWTGRTILKSTATGLVNILNNAEDAGVGLNVTTDGTLQVRNRAQNADGAVSFSVGSASTRLSAPVFRGTGTGVSVANVGANSCGTTAATIAGNEISGVITVGATAGTQCRVTFTTAAPVARDCTVTDSTTTIATRATAVSTTTHDFLGAFVAGDLVTYVCMVR